MARGRSVLDFERVYIDGYDMSGYTSDPGERGIVMDRHNSKCLADAVIGALPSRPDWMFGPLNGVFDNTPTSGIHVLANAAKGTRRNVMHIRGVLAVPAIGGDAFCGPFLQTVYVTGSGDLVTAKLEFAYDVSAGLNYSNPFGALLHTLTSETGANTANTNADEGGQTTKGGWLQYHITSITGSGTVTISVDDSSTGTSGWAPLSGATSGAIATASAPTSGFVQLGVTATVKEYLRWQLAFGGSASACTFALSFMRGRQ